MREFKEAVERFKQDIPNIVHTLRGMILDQGKTNAPFLELCRTAINPAVTPDDVDEMLIQHLLTEEIFLSIFSDTQLLEENNIAPEELGTRTATLHREGILKLRQSWV